jgi:hypothetical protein
MNNAPPTEVQGIACTSIVIAPLLANICTKLCMDSLEASCVRMAIWEPDKPKPLRLYIINFM